MKVVHTALMQFWKKLGVDVYLSGHVPNGASFPYITIDVSAGEYFHEASMTLFDWHKWSDDKGIGPAMDERAVLMDKIAKAIPYAGGVNVPVNGGFIMLYRPDTDFQNYYDDPVDPHVIGGRTAYDAVFYMQ